MKKDLSGLRNEKTILLALLLQIFMAMFSSFLMVGLTSMYDPSSLAGGRGVVYPVGYIGEDPTLAAILDGRPDLRVYRMELSPAVAALKERRLGAVIYVPGADPEAGGPVKITVYSIQNDIQATIINAKLKEVFMEYEEDLRDARTARLTSRPVQLVFPPGGGNATFFQFVYALLIPLLLFLPGVISAALVIDLICEEFEQQTLGVLLSTPLSLAELVGGKIGLCILLVPFEAGAWLGLLALNGITIARVPHVILLVMVSSAALILAAAVAALSYRDRTSAQVIFSLAVVVLLIPLLSIPGNPVNMVALLSTGSPAPGFFLLTGAMAGVAAVLAALVCLMIRKASLQ